MSVLSPGQPGPPEASDPRDRLYHLLPAFYQMRDGEVGEPLRALLQIVTEQVIDLETDIGQLYDNWFIETCDDWVVPYIADLIGYEPVLDPGAIETVGRRQLDVLVPRNDVANAVRARLRKGTLALLEDLARDVANWPARAVEFYRLLEYHQALNHPRPERGQTVDLRHVDILDRIDGPFDECAHTVSVGRIDAARTRTWFNIPNVGLFAWRLQPYAITRAPAYSIDRANNRYTFSVLGNNAPLITKPVLEPEPTHIAGEMNVPEWIRRRALHERPADYYGPGKSIRIWRDGVGPAQAVPLEAIVAADLSEWRYRPKPGEVAIDPVLGRIVFPSRNAPRAGVWVTWHYGFSDDTGGGEYPRQVRPVRGFTPDDGSTAIPPGAGPPAGKVWFAVGPGQGMVPTITKALERWREHRPADAIIEIQDSGVYVEQLEILLEPGQKLELRAADGTRPVIRLLDWYTNRSDALRIGQVPRPPAPDDEQAPEPEPAPEQDRRVPEPAGAPAATQPVPCAPSLLLDGLLITGRSVQVIDTIANVTIRHCTLVPGWSIGNDCEPESDTEPSLEVIDSLGCLTIERSIVGGIRVNEDEVATDPIRIDVADSILDATDPAFHALIGADDRFAHATLSIRRSTVFGGIRTHAIALAENAIFTGPVRVARRQVGCIRYSFVPPGSRTPRRHQCQPDLVEQAAGSDAGKATRERRRVTPRFSARRYGIPVYARLDDATAPEILQGADDEGSMGAFHDLYEPQRLANLRTRLAEFVPAGSDAAVIFRT